MVAIVLLDGYEPIEVEINPAFEALLPPLSAEEHDELVRSIHSEGVRDPLIVWSHDGHYTLIDGHNRWRIAAKSFDAFEMGATALTFPHESAAMAWMIQNQFARRNLPAFVRVKLALKLKSVLADARANGVPIEGRLNDKIGEMADLSHEQVRKVHVVLERGPEAVVKAAENGSISTHRAYLVTKALDGAPPEVAELVAKHSLDDSDTIRLLTRLKNDNRDSFWELYQSGYLQPGEEEEAVPVTAGFAALQEALRKVQQAHVRENVAVKVQEAVEKNGDAPVRGLEFEAGTPYEVMGRCREAGELFQMILISAPSSAAATAIFGERHAPQRMLDILTHNGVLAIRLLPGHSLKPIVVAENGGFLYAGAVLARNPARGEWTLTHLLSKSPLDLSGRDEVVVEDTHWEWHYEAWAQIASRFGKGGAALDLLPVPPAFSAIGAAHAVQRVVVQASGDTERQIRAAAATFSRLRVAQP